MPKFCHDFSHDDIKTASKSRSQLNMQAVFNRLGSLGRMALRRRGTHSSKCHQHSDTLMKTLSCCYLHFAGDSIKGLRSPILDIHREQKLLD